MAIEMVRKFNRDQEVSLAAISKEYRELKTVRNQIVSELMARVEREIESRRLQFAGTVYRAKETNGLTVAAIAGAMGTSARKTVYEYLEMYRDYLHEHGEVRAAVEAEVEAAQPFEVLETLAWNDIPHVRKILATGADGAAAVGAARLVVSRADESVKGWVISVVSHTGRKFGFVEDKDGFGNWFGGRGAYRLRENSDAATSWDELAQQQTGQVRELVLWVAENITDWGE